VSHHEREYPRYAHEAAVKVRAGQRAFEGRTRNVSRGGLCATIVDPLAVGTEVELELVLVFDQDLQSDALRLPARVVWCTPVDEAHQVGLVFRPFDARRAEQIDLFLSFLEEHRDDAPAAARTVDDRFR
jgi:Tfp pilus assembly protein PilZ